MRDLLVSPEKNPPNFARAICSHILEYEVWKAQALGSSIHRESQFTWITEHDSCPLCLLHEPLDSGILELRLSSMRSILKSSRFQGAVLLSTEITDLSDEWIDRGFTVITREYGMTLSLPDWGDPRFFESDLTIEPASSLDDFENCYSVIVSGRNRSMADYFNKIYRDKEKNSSRDTVYQAKIGNNPVGICVLFRSSGTAGIWWLTIRPEYRNKGIGSALTAYALKEARKERYSISVLQSKPDLVNLYNRIGFKESCLIKLVQWKNIG